MDQIQIFSIYFILYQSRKKEFLSLFSILTYPEIAIRSISISNKIKPGHVRELGLRGGGKKSLKLGAREIRSGGWKASNKEGKKKEGEREREGAREPLFDYPLARCNNEFIKMLGRMRAQSADPSPSTIKMVLEGLARNNLHLHAYI